MSQDKKLIIGSQFDGKGLEGAEKALKRLQKEGLRIGNILKGLDLSTGSGRGRFAKSIIETEKQMGKLKGTTQDTAKVLGGVYGRQLDIEAKRLDRTTRQLEKLNKLRKEQQTSYESASKAGAGEAELRKRREIMNRTEDTISMREGTRRVQSSNLDELRGTKPSMTTQDKLLLMKSVADAVGGMASAFQSTKNLGFSNQAAVGGFHGDIMRQFLGGNFALSDALTNGRKDIFGKNLKGRDLMSGAEGRIAAGVENVAHGAGGVLTGALSWRALKGARGGEADGAGGGMSSQVATGNAMGGLAGAGTDIVNSLVNPVSGGMNATEANTLRQRASLVQQADPTRQLVYEQLAQNAGGRLAASRRLGGRHMGMAGMGAGFALDPFGEALPFATGLADQFGATSVTGKNGLMKNSLQMEQFGLDRGKAGMMLGTMGNANGGTQNARKELEEIFSRGIRRGLSPENVQYFEMIGKAVADHAFGQGGETKSFSAFGQAMSFGLNANSNMHEVQRNAGGAQALDNLNQNGYFRAINLEQAKKQLGSGADWASAQGLGDASWSELAGGSEEMNALGITGGQRKSAMQTRMSAMLDTVVGKGKSGIGAKLLAAKNKAGGWEGALGGKDDTLRRQAAALLHQTLKGAPGGFQSFDESFGAVNFMEGLSQGPESGRLNKRFGDGNAYSQKATQGSIQMQLAGQEKNIVSRDVFANAQKFFAELTKVQPGLNAATDAVKALEDVYDVLAKIAKVAPAAAKKMQGKEGIQKAGAPATTGRTNWDHY